MLRRIIDRIPLKRLVAAATANAGAIFIMGANRIYLNVYHWEAAICVVPYIAASRLIVLQSTYWGKEQ